MPIASLRRTCTAAILAVAFLAPASAQQGPLPVDVATPRVERIFDWDEFTGRFEAAQRVELRARVSGYLQEIRFRDGEVVNKDDILFVIDPRPFNTAHARVTAELQSARADQSLAEAELARAEELVGNRTISESIADERRAAKLRSDAQVAVAEAAVADAALDLEFTMITAPFTGRISDNRIDAGNLVAAGETVLATIVSTDPINLVFTASEADFLKYSRLDLAGNRPSSREAANPVLARLIDEDGWPHRGQMDFVANELDPNAGTITGRAVFDNKDELLIPGLFARLRLLGSGEYEALLVPEQAILSDQSRKIIMTVGEDGVVAAKVVTPGPLHRGLRVIRSGLSADDRFIVAGLQRARPGAKVVPQDVTFDFPETAASD